MNAATTAENRPAQWLVIQVRTCGTAEVKNVTAYEYQGRVLILFMPFYELPIEFLGSPSVVFIESSASTFLCGRRIWIWTWLPSSVNVRTYPRGNNALFMHQFDPHFWGVLVLNTDDQRTSWPRHIASAGGVAHHSYSVLLHSLAQFHTDSRIPSTNIQSMDINPYTLAETFHLNQTGPPCFSSRLCYRSLLA